MGVSKKDRQNALILAVVVICFMGAWMWVTSIGNRLWSGILAGLTLLLPLLSGLFSITYAARGYGLNLINRNFLADIFQRATTRLPPHKAINKSMVVSPNKATSVQRLALTASGVLTLWIGIYGYYILYMVLVHGAAFD